MSIVKGLYSFWNIFCLSSSMLKTLCFFLGLPFLGLTQFVSNPSVGASVGLIFNVGTNVNTIGINFNSYYHDYFYQVNAGQSAVWNLSSYGGRQRFWEFRTDLGLVLLAGRRDARVDFQLDGLIHNTEYNYGIAYNYLWYYDQAGTSQRSGGWGFHFKNAALLFENDIFGGQGKDRFRTGHLMFSVRNENWKYYGGLYLWTGETANSMWERITLPSCPSGFRLLEDLPYGRTSHGIVYGGFNYHLGYNQIVHFKLGVDGENIRHFAQNRLIHDLIFLPKSVKRNTPHYPRLNEYGCPVFDKKEVRKPLIYLQQGLNGPWSN